MPATAIDGPPPEKGSPVWELGPSDDEDAAAMGCPEPRPLPDDPFPQIRNCSSGRCGEEEEAWRRDTPPPCVQAAMLRWGRRSGQPSDGSFHSVGMQPHLLTHRRSLASLRVAVGVGIFLPLPSSLSEGGCCRPTPPPPRPPPLAIGRCASAPCPSPPHPQWPEKVWIVINGSVGMCKYQKVKSVP